MHAFSRCWNFKKTHIKQSCSYSSGSKEKQPEPQLIKSKLAPRQQMRQWVWNQAMQPWEYWKSLPVIDHSPGPSPFNISCPVLLTRFKVSWYRLILPPLSVSYNRVDAATSGFVPALFFPLEPFSIKGLAPNAAERTHVPRCTGTRPHIRPVWTRGQPLFGRQAFGDISEVAFISEFMHGFINNWWQPYSPLLNSHSTNLRQRDT